MTAPYSGGQNQGMDQMIRMLQAITAMQSTRRGLDLEEQKLKESQSEFAKSFGLQEKTERFKAMEYFAKLASDLPEGARGTLRPAAQAAGLGPESVDLVMSAPRALQSLLEAKAKQGVDQLNPQSVAGVATGVGTQGQQTQDAFNALAARQAIGNPQMIGSAAEKMSGFNPLNSQVEALIGKDPDLLSAYARQVSGKATQLYQNRMATTAETEAGTQAASVQGQIIDRRMGIAADLIMGSWAQQGKNFSQQLASARMLQSWAAQIKGLKGNDKLARIQQFNTLAETLGWNSLRYKSGDDPGQEQALQDMVTKLGTMQQQPQMPMGLPQGMPQQSPPGMPNLQQNPLTPFLQPRQP